MMSEEKYKELWKGINQLKQGVKMPSYHGYLQREVYFQDYLDLFLQSNINNITYKRKKIGRFQTVSFPGLVSDPTGEFTIKDPVTGDIRLKVEHEYPFMKQVFSEVKNIDYVLIGEAAPGSGKYIYKDASNSYITAPLTAIGVNVDKLSPKSKSKDLEGKLKLQKEKSALRLAEFAKKGFILLDLLPFALDFNEYSNLRDKIIKSDNGLIKFYIERLEDLIFKLQKKSHNWDFCFVGPETISMAAIKLIQEEKGGLFAGKKVNHHDDKLDSDDFIYRKKKVNVVKSNYTAYPGEFITHISKRARLTTIIGGSGPHSELIQRVFGLK
jgi:hypothetical protein